MSRDQETAVANTASTQNATDFKESQDADKSASDAIATQLATNPYTPGGDFSTTTNRQLSNTADVGAATTAEQLQQQAQRTGQNPQAANATAVANAQANERALSGQEATATQERETGDVGVESGVEGEEGSLASQEGNEANGLLNTDQAASNQPSFLDEFGNAVAGTLGGGGIKASYAIPGCWIAAELYGGWLDARTVLVREWLGAVYSRTRLGAVVVGMYGLFGQRTASAIRRWPMLRRVFLPIFDKALVKARAWKGGV